MLGDLDLDLYLDTDGDTDTDTDLDTDLDTDSDGDADCNLDGSGIWEWLGGVLHWGFGRHFLFTRSVRSFEVMSDLFHRTRLLVGDAGVARLRGAAVAVIGLGGVGGYVAEAVARAGVGRLLLVDADVVDITNLNRQLYALHNTVGLAKVDVARDRIAQINPDAVVEGRAVFVDESNVAALGLDPTWHVIDAIDTMASKVALLRYLHGQGIPCLSSMGAGRRCDPGRVRLADISKTQGCPLAREVRRRLRGHGVVSGICCVFSDELPVVVPESGDGYSGVRGPVGSIAHVPGLFGLTAAGWVINRIVGMGTVR